MTHRVVTEHFDHYATLFRFEAFANRHYNWYFNSLVSNLIWFLFAVEIRIVFIIPGFFGRNGNQI